MINANELRMGNWIYKTEFGSDKEEKKLYIIKYPHMDFTFTKAYFPIPLTPEILVKAGFVKGVTPNGLEKFDLSIYRVYLVGDHSFHIDGDNEYYPTIRNINYLHQLQNLYFALTGEELDIKM